MGERTGIAWTDHTLNPIIGCSKVSEACKHCYAEIAPPTRVHRAKGLELWGVDGARHETKDWEASARKWNRKAERDGVRRRVFCASLADVFEDRPEWVPVRARLARLVVDTPHLDWLLLTKRPENAQRLWVAACPFAQEPNERDVDDDAYDPGACICGEHSCAEGWIGNVWLGTTVETQTRADERIPHLLAVPAAVRFLSVEPQLEAISFDGARLEWLMPFKDTDAMLSRTPRIDWIIQGGESGKNARPFDIAWARSLRDQCRKAGVAYFLKQLGAAPLMASPSDHVHLRGGTCALRPADSHGGDESEWPSDLRGCRAFPEVRT